MTNHYDSNFPEFDMLFKNIILLLPCNTYPHIIHAESLFTPVMDLKAKLKVSYVPFDTFRHLKKDKITQRNSNHSRMKVFPKKRFFSISFSKIVFAHWNSCKMLRFKKNAKKIFTPPPTAIPRKFGDNLNMPGCEDLHSSRFFKTIMSIPFLNFFKSRF